MKKVFILLFLILNICTFNVWAQDGEPEFPYNVSKNAVTENMPICIATPGWNGIMYMYLDGQSLYNGYWGGGYMLLKDETHVDITSQIGVYPGGKLKIWASVYGVGDTNTIEITVPDTGTELRLYIYGSNVSMNQINAHFE